MIISIHALAKRATVEILTAGDIPKISIHALAKRATDKIFETFPIFEISIHALAKRATYQNAGNNAEI